MKRRVVVKLGTSVLTGGTGALDAACLAGIATQIAALRRAGHQVLVCTSGAVAAGRERLGISNAGTVAHKQMLAAVGQSRLMRRWEEAFDPHGLVVGQVLLTHHDVHDQRRCLNARDTLNELLALGIVPVINENDAVATEELRVGDNDTIAAYAAILTEADLLVLLTDQAGLFTSDPRLDPNAELIAEIRHIDDALDRLAGDSVSGLGVGGMATKLKAADVARRAGVDVVIASGHAPAVLTRLVGGSAVGTRFPALADPVEGRRRRIMAAMRPGAGTVVDAGAAAALRGQNTSLLPCGVLAVKGAFERGATVSIETRDGGVLGRGVARYGSRELDAIRGHRSEEIERILGYTLGPVAIHRRDLVLV